LLIAWEDADAAVCAINLDTGELTVNDTEVTDMTEGHEWQTRIIRALSVLADKQMDF